MRCTNNYLLNDPCAKSIGGIKRMWYTFKDNIATVGDYDDVYIGDVHFNPRYIATLILNDGNFVEVVSKPDAVTITENITVNEITDSSTTEITIKQSDMLTDAIVRLKGSVFDEYVFLFEDMQGRYFLYGIDKPVTLSSGTVASGNVMGDFNGGTFTFTTEGVLSRLWTKYEAEYGDYTSNYVKVKELFQDTKLKKLGNFNSLVFDTGKDFHEVGITKAQSKVSIDLNFTENHYQLSQRDHFVLEMPNGNFVSLATFDNDDMYSIVSYYIRKGLILTDKRKFKVVLDSRNSELFTELWLKLDTGVRTECVTTIEGIPSTYFAIIEGEVIFKREPQSEEDTVVINSIKYMPSDWN